MDQTYINSKTSSQEKEPNYTTFISQLFYVILSIIISIIIASIFLYMTKISQTNIINTIINILDTNKDKDTTKDVTKEINKEIDVNIVKQYSDFFGKFGLGFLSSKKPEVYTTKVLFNDNIEDITKNLKLLIDLKNKVYGKSLSQTEYNKLKEEQFISSNKKKEENDKTSQTKNEEPTNSNNNTFILWYIYNIVSQTLTSSLWGLNSLFNLLGKYLSESIILIIFSFFSGTFVILFSIIIFILTIFYTIVNFLKIYDSRIPGIISTEKKEIKKTEFKFYFGNFARIFTYPNLFLLFMLFSGTLFVIGLSIFNFFYVIYIFLNNNGKTITKNENKSENQNFNFINLCKSTFKYKSQLIMLLFSYKLYNDVIANLGNTYIWSFFIALLLFLIFTNVFNSYIYNPVNDTNLTSGFSNQETSPEINSPKIPQKSQTTQEKSPETISSETPQEKSPETISTETPQEKTSETPQEKTSETISSETLQEKLPQTTGGGKVLCKNTKHFIRHLKHYK